MSIHLNRECLAVMERIAQAGFRITHSRRAIVQVLLVAENALSPQEIFELARQADATLGQVTAYRTLDLLSQLGLVRRLHTEDGCHRYARISAGHRHHLSCRQCGRVVEFEGCDLSEMLERVSRQTGFAIDEHMLELEGTCPNCQQHSATVNSHVCH